MSFTTRVLSCAVIVACACGCQPEQRDVRYKPFFTGVEGAEELRFGTPPTVEKASREPVAGPAMVENADGSVRLVTSTPSQLFGHLRKLLGSPEILRPSQEAAAARADVAAGVATGQPPKPMPPLKSRELLGRQLLARETVAEFEAMGLTGDDAYDRLVAHRDHIIGLFRAMPFGERTPNVLMERLGPNLMRVRVTGRMAEDLAWTFVDVRMERGQWKLVWFGPGGTPREIERDPWWMEDLRRGRP